MNTHLRAAVHTHARFEITSATDHLTNAAAIHTPVLIDAHLRAASTRQQAPALINTHLRAASTRPQAPALITIHIVQTKTAHTN